MASDFTQRTPAFVNQLLLIAQCPSSEVLLVLVSQEVSATTKKEEKCSESKSSNSNKPKRAFTHLKLIMLTSQRRMLESWTVRVSLPQLVVWSSDLMVDGAQSALEEWLHPQQGQSAAPWNSKTEPSRLNIDKKTFIKNERIVVSSLPNFKAKSYFSLRYL